MRGFFEGTAEDVPHSCAENKNAHEWAIPAVAASGPPACLGSAHGGAATFLMMTSCPFALYEPWLANSGGNFAFTASYNVNNYASIRAGGVPALGADPQSWGDFTLTEVPEPSIFPLLGTGMLGFAGVVRRKISR